MWVSVGFAICLAFSSGVNGKEPLRIFTWDGYVTADDLVNVNALLVKAGYDFEAVVIDTPADDADQMFNVIRSGQVDVCFLTLFFIKMKDERMARLLKPIDTTSPRLANYAKLEPSLTEIPIGIFNGRKLYIPWGGGAYGFYVNRDTVEEKDVPASLLDLWKPEWKGRVSYNRSQEWYNVGLALMSMGKSPFYINQQVWGGDRADLKAFKSDNGVFMDRLTQLYANAGGLWNSAPSFAEGLDIVSSWGPEIVQENKKGGNWQLIQFKEGSMVWLDTINFVHSLQGKKLEAAEIFANYFIGRKVQSRIVESLSMVAASTLVDKNPLIDENPNFFQNDLFVPPYDMVSGNVVRSLTNRALVRAGVPQE
ncbi:spermidine/putrescine ABC transporter substrate-binding protein [Gammaproteobacteria bacterium 45_16_T64]|nr:spermidine/putrescine ABC transporter substrate-binding protein [Gammaproteobacteria bacterium 45_16_T64]